MKLSSIATTILVLMCHGEWASVSAQTMDDLNLQVHGYATQGFVYSTNNNWDTTDSSDGSSAWTEAVLNVTSQPAAKLRVGVQARYYLLGTFGNQIVLDWAQADYKVTERFGVRFGKVKSPVGLLNDSQDIDPAHLWVLLPQSVYPLSSRNSVLAHYGGVAYGSIPLGEFMGKLEYHAFGGARVLGGGDGFFQPLRDAGLSLPNGESGAVVGASLAWHTPIPGLLFGASESREHPGGQIVAGPLQGTIDDSHFYIPYFFARYEHSRLMLAGEYNRIALNSTVQFPGRPAFVTPLDLRAFYFMGSYKIAKKLSGGLYYSSTVNRQAAFNSNRYQKDWALSGRYDVNPFLYLKLEEHFVDGSQFGYSTIDNSNTKPNTRMTLIKLGVSF